MEIDKGMKDKLSSIKEYYQHTKTNDDVEFEALVRPRKVTKTQFSSLVQYFRSTNLDFKFHEDVLNVMFKHMNVQYRYEIYGSNDINLYCKTNDIRKVTRKTLTQKSIIHNKYPIEIDEYDVKINVKSETKIEGDSKKELVKDINEKLYDYRKMYRFKKRFSFISEDKLFRFDLSVVKQSLRDGEKNLIKSGLFQSDDHYEVEIEFLHQEHDRYPSEDVFVRSLMSQAGLVLSVIDQDDFIIPKSKKEGVLANYLKLCKIDVSNPRMPPGRKFVGPMPITLEKRNLLDTDLGVTSITKDYTVTDKADGERQLLYIDDDGKCYLINNKLNVRYTGISVPELKHTLLDGEYITKTKTGSSIKIFAAFDVYFDRNENICKLPLVAEDDKGDSRLTRMQMITKKLGNDDFKVDAKEFLYGKNIFDDSKSILAKSDIGDLVYKIDGLIYTPRYLPVGGAYQDSTPTLGGTWVKVFKWKPPEDNSIDFMVKTAKNEQTGTDVPPVNIEGIWHKVVKLYVGYSGRIDDPITPYAFLMKEVKFNESSRNHKLFAPPEEPFDVSTAYITLDTSNTMRCQSGEVIYDGDVIEFTFKNKEWVPLRARRDKDRGNDHKTAKNIWRSMNNPVLKEVICGDVKLSVDENEVIDNDQYYNRVESRDKSASKKMLDFHNHWVKDMSLIAKFKGKAKSVFDIACGKGSDFYKYGKAGMNTIVGFDKSEDNITNPDDGAYSRLLDSNIEGKTIVCLPMDCSRVIDESYIDTIKDEKTKDIARLLYGQASIPKLEKYHGLISNQFDLVSCQFAVHYFFANQTTLHALLTNVSNALKPNGYFIGTCLDGRIVNNKFTESKKNNKTDYIEGKINDRVIWNIRKMYDDFDTNRPHNNYGLKVDVYMETINQRMSEYIVDFQLLEEELSKFGIRSLTVEESKDLVVDNYTGTFKDLFEKMTSSGMRNRFIDNALNMSQEEKDYSFMNRWFIFKKAGAKPDNANIEQEKPKVVKKVVKRVKK